jgi:hypothetical protein
MHDGEIGTGTSAGHGGKIRLISRLESLDIFTNIPFIQDNQEAKNSPRGLWQGHFVSRIARQFKRSTPFLEDQLADVGGTLCPSVLRKNPVPTSLFPYFKSFYLIGLTAQNLRRLHTTFESKDFSRQVLRKT